MRDPGIALVSAKISVGFTPNHPQMVVVYGQGEPHMERSDGALSQVQMHEGRI